MAPIHHGFCCPLRSSTMRRHHQLPQHDVVMAPARDQRARAFREARRTGVLSYPAKGLSEFPVEIYHLEEHMDKDEKKWECVDLLRIDLSHNSIPAIADDVAGLTTLTSLKLCQNALTALPEGLYELTSLVYLDLSNNRLEGTLSESLGKLENLKDLALGSNKLTQLPASLGRLAALEALRIEENQLSNLPDTIGGLRKLHTLSAHSNLLSALPPSFRALTNVQTLDLKKNYLQSTSECLATLHGLKYLDLRQNKLVIFPVLPQSTTLDQVFLGYNALVAIDEDSILRVKDSITVLDLRDNKLAQLPANVACLYRLKTLDVANNELSDLPPGLGYLKHLNHMVVDGNPLRAIRRGIVSAGCESLKKYLRTRGAPPPGVDAMEEEVDEFQARERERQANARPATDEPASASSEFDSDLREAASSGTLVLTGRGLARLPPGLCSAPKHDFASSLLHLTMTKNRLTELPAAIAQLTALTSLTVEDNQLCSIDPALAQLPHLQLLRLRKNQLTSEAIDEFLGDRRVPLGQCIKELDLRNNLLTYAPEALRVLGPSLETLLLAFNRLESLERFPWHTLERVSLASVADNKLRSLGRIYDMPKIASLSFENNNLTSVPCELGLCPHLRAIYMNGNPQKTVRGAVIAKGSMEILAFLKNRLPLGTTLTPPPDDADDVAVRSPRLTPRHAPEEPHSSSLTSVKSIVQPKKLAMYAATGNNDNDDIERPSPMARSQPIRQEIGRGGAEGIVEKLNAQIQNLELELENHGMTAAKRFAMKKEVAMLRSQRIREERRRDTAA